MSYTTCYWDDAAGVQREREATPEEVAEIEARKAAWLASQPTLADHVAAALKRIDADVDAIYGDLLGNRTAEYELAEREAQAYIDAGYLGAVPASVQSWATAKSWTAQAAADDIAANAAAWRSAQAAIRAERLLRKEQARVAADEAALDAVLAQWAGFVAAVRVQLEI